MIKDGTVKIDIEGHKELVSFLNKLPNDVRTNFIKKGLQGAAAVAVKNVRSKTPIGPTGNLKRSIGYKFVKATENKKNLYGIVGARMKRWGASNNFKGHHAHLVAGGHTAKNGRKIQGIGQWIKQAGSEVSSQMFERFGRDYWKYIDRSVKQYIRKTAFKFR